MSDEMKAFVRQWITKAEEDLIVANQLMQMEYPPKVTQRISQRRSKASYNFPSLPLSFIIILHSSLIPIFTCHLTRCETSLPFRIITFSAFLRVFPGRMEQLVFWWHGRRNL